MENIGNWGDFKEDAVGISLFCPESKRRKKENKSHKKNWKQNSNALYYSR